MNATSTDGVGGWVVSHHVITQCTFFPPTDDQSSIHIQHYTFLTPMPCF